MGRVDRFSLFLFLMKDPGDNAFRGLLDNTTFIGVAFEQCRGKRFCLLYRKLN
jgi:hypothetical protein